MVLGVGAVLAVGAFISKLAGWGAALRVVKLGEFRMIIFAMALIIIMIFRPQGLLGVREIWDASLWRPVLRRLGWGRGQRG
jgi:branched-chain amino acid transport system permease protein